METEVEQDDLAQALSESWDRSAAANTERHEVAETAPAEVPTGAITGTDPLAASDAAAPVEAPEPKPDADGRVRGADGKFASAAAPKPALAQGAAAPAASAAAQDQPWQKAPQSLKPEAREKWASVPAEIQQDIHRRERDTAVALQRATEQTRAAEPLLRAVQPFAQQLAARGQSPADVISNFMRTEQALSHPDERTRAQVIAGALGTYRVSVQALADAIEAGPQQHQQQPQGITPQAVQQMVQEQFAQREQHGAYQRAQSEIGAFKGEFLNDLKPAMGALIQAGLATDLQSAYDAACWADPRIRGIIQQREASKSAANATASTQRAKAASSSIRSSPAGASNGAAPADDSWGAHLDAAWEKAAAR